MMKKRLHLLMAVLAFGLMSLSAQTAEGPHFKDLLPLMKYKAAGKTMAELKAYGETTGMPVIYEGTQGPETFIVWGEGVSYERKGMTEIIKATDEKHRLLSFDLTDNNGKYTPIVMTVLFADKEAQARFRQEGLAFGCIENKSIDEEEIDITWQNVTGIKYNENSRVLSSWRFCFFYEKDGLYWATFQ